MNILSLLTGALALRTETFKTLRERSDVFQRGFILLLLIALLAAIFDTTVPVIERTVHPQSEAQVTQEVLRSIRSSSPYFQNSPTIGAIVEQYVSEGVAMGFEISRLPPNAGPAFRPIASILNWLGEVLSKPFSFAVLGYLFLAALVVQLTSLWLGGRAAMAQMLGLGALSYAPQIFYPVSSLLMLGSNLTGLGAIGTVNGLLGLLLFAWSTVIYIKAVAIAQEFSYGRAMGAILIALGLVLLVVILLACLMGGLIASLLVPVLSNVP